MNGKRSGDYKKRIYQYVLRLVKFVAALPHSVVLDEIKRQLIASGSSVGANYFEAQAGASMKEFRTFLNHSLKSANESRFWLALLRDSGLIQSNALAECETLLQETTEIAKILGRSVVTLRNRERRSGSERL